MNTFGNFVSTFNNEGSPARILPVTIFGILTNLDKVLAGFFTALEENNIHLPVCTYT